MKKLLLAVVMLCVCGISRAEVTQEPQKFEIKYIIKYNSLTFQEASDKEILIRKKFEDACSIDIKVDEVSTITFYEVN